MFLKRLFTSCCALLIMSAPAAAGTSAAATEALMRRSGLWDQLADIKPQVRAGVLNGISQSGGRPSEAEVERISSAVDAAYGANRLRAQILLRMSRQLDAARLPELRRWYDAPLGQRIVGLEKALSSNADTRSIIEQGTALLRDMPPARARAVDETVAVTRAAEFGADIAIGSELAIRRAAVSSSPSAAFSWAELKSVLEGQRQQLTMVFAAMLRANFAVAYKSLATEDIRAYIDFLKSGAGRHHTEVVLDAMQAAMLDAADDLGRRLAGTKDKSNI